MVEFVWVRLGNKVSRFPVVSKKNKVKLRVQDIISFWKLGNAPSLTIGSEHALLTDRQGYSVMTVQDIQTLAEKSGLGDGKTRGSAIQITAQDDEQEEEETDEEALAASETKRDRKRSRLDGELQEQSEKQRLFYDPGCMYAYKGRLEKLGEKKKPEVYERHFFKEMRAFVGTLHVVSAPDEALGVRNCVGMASLWKLDGSCLTSHECVKDLPDGKLLVVCFKHLEKGNTVAYQCKAKNLDSWALLEPVKARKFKECLAIGSQWGVPVSVYSFSLDSEGELTPVLTKGATIWSSGRIQSILTTSRMNTLGAPLLNVNGLLSGIVSGFIALDGVNQSFCLRPKDKEITVEQLRARVDRYKRYPLYKDLVEGLEVQQLVKATWTRSRKFVCPVTRWNRDHPLTESGFRKHVKTS